MKNFFTSVRLPSPAGSKNLDRECAAAICETVSVLKMVLSNLDDENFSPSFKKRFPSVHKAESISSVDKNILRYGDIVILKANTDGDFKEVKGIYIYEGVGA